jgi:hypothetical protein
MKPTFKDWLGYILNFIILAIVVWVLMWGSADAPQW